ncbi:FAD/NAD-P-binding domain-containing protein [Russula emetica]|nr:FAD/NAD-P-binding domain-containing protein [Russula emetica]
MAPLKLAIIGGGPSSFYVASRLLSLFPKDEPLSSQLRIHIYDKLWAPHGLVRYGVAPDHPEVKNCTHKFDRAAGDPRIRFFGNVQVGPQTPPTISHALPISLSSLKPHYTHLLLSTGCTIPTLHPALPPSSDRVIPALSLVHWYTQHPSRPASPPLHKTEHVSIIGQGNVALDVARMLLTPPDILEKYDVPTSVLDVLYRSAVRHVSIIGRRGPLQAAFTTKELRELTTLPGASMIPLPHDIITPASGTKLTRQQSRTLQLLQQGGSSTATPTHTSNSINNTSKKSWSLDFFRSPTGFTADGQHLTLAHTALNEHSCAVPTGASSLLRTDLVVTALGHHSDPLLAYYDSSLGHLRTDRGRRVLDATSRALRRVYASGWVATGARGVLAATMIDAYAVADTILADHFGDGSGGGAETVPVQDEAVPKAVEQGAKEKRVVEYDQWKKLDVEEMRRGAEMGKERERMGWEEVHEFLTSARGC